MNKAVKGIFALSAAAIVFLVWLIYFKERAQTDMTFVGYLPLINAILNSLCATSLILGYKAIRRKDKKLHKRFMITAFSFSALFLISYVIYHHFHGDTKFVGPAMLKFVYFVILISHILLSIVNLPMILMTFYLAYKQKWKRHRRLARPTFAIWLYVSVSGVLVYLFVQHLNHL